MPDPKWIERPLGLLVPKPCHEVSEEQIRAHLQGFVEKGIITSYSVPDRIVFVEALPKTSVGKLDKKVMRERYAQEFCDRLLMGLERSREGRVEQGRAFRRIFAR